MEERQADADKDSGDRAGFIGAIQHARHAIDDWISFYNHHRPYQALEKKTAAEPVPFAA